MSDKYSVEEVRARLVQLNAFVNDKCSNDEAGRKCLGFIFQYGQFLAERIEADESAARNLDTGNLVDDPSYLALDALYERGWTDSEKHKHDARGTNEWQKVLNLFRTHPPAQAAQVVGVSAIEATRRLDALALSYEHPEIGAANERERSLILDFIHGDDVWQVFEDLHRSATAELAAPACADGGVGIDCVSHSSEPVAQTLADFVNATDAERVQIGQQVAERVDGMMGDSPDAADSWRVGELLAYMDSQAQHPTDQFGNGANKPNPTLKAWYAKQAAIVRALAAQGQGDPLSADAWRDAAADVLGKSSNLYHMLCHWAAVYARKAPPASPAELAAAQQPTQRAEGE